MYFRVDVNIDRVDRLNSNCTLSLSCILLWYVIPNTQASALGQGAMNPLLQALGDKPSSRQSFLYTGPSTDLDAMQHRAAVPPGLMRPTDGQQRRTMSEENGGGPPHGDGPKMVSWSSGGLTLKAVISFCNI